MHLNSEGLLVAKLKTWLRKRFRAAAPIRDVQDAILNIGHSYLRKATAFRDIVTSSITFRYIPCDTTRLLPRLPLSVYFPIHEVLISEGRGNLVDFGT